MGCGTVHCTNRNCFSCPEGPRLDPTSAALLAVKLAQAFHPHFPGCFARAIVSAGHPHTDSLNTLHTTHHLKGKGIEKDGEANSQAERTHVPKQAIVMPRATLQTESKPQTHATGLKID